METEEPALPDIDEAEKGNPLAVAEYAQDIYAFYRQREVLSCVPPDYMSQQSDVNQKMRAILIDWIIEEKSILKTLQFNLTVPTPYVFMTRFLKAAGSDKDLEMVVSFLLEVCLVEYVMLKYPPSMLGAAAVYSGRCILRRAPSWNKTMECHTTYTEDQLIGCAKLMAGFHQTARKGKLTTVHRKYSSPKFNYVSKLEPDFSIGPNYL